MEYRVISSAILNNVIHSAAIKLNHWQHMNLWREFLSQIVPVDGLAPLGA